jgi:hypothetical protein
MAGFTHHKNSEGQIDWVSLRLGKVVATDYGDKLVINSFGVQNLSDSEYAHLMVISGYDFDGSNAAAIGWGE